MVNFVFFSCCGYHCILYIDFFLLQLLTSNYSIFVKCFLNLYFDQRNFVILGFSLLMKFSVDVNICRLLVFGGLTEKHEV